MLSGELERAEAAVVSQVLNVKLRALELERKWKELGELEDRLGGPREGAQGKERGMNRKGLGKLYDRLTSEERFRLDIEAMARGDEEESRKLVETCPRRSYVMNDLGFAGRWDGAIQMTLVTLLDLRPVVAKLRMIAAFRAVFSYCRTLAQDDAHFAYFDGHEAGSRHARERAGMQGEPPGWEDDEGTAEENADPAMVGDLEKISLRVEESFDLIPGGLLDRLEPELVGEAVAVWEAYTQFCEEEVGLRAEKVLRATFEPALQNVRFLEELADKLGLEPEPATIEKYRAALVEGWRRFVGRV